MILVLLALNFLLMILLPLLLGRWIARRRGPVGACLAWERWLLCCPRYHLPFNWLVLQKWGWVDASRPVLYALFLGLSAGSFEGVARYLSFRFCQRGTLLGHRADGWRGAWRHRGDFAGCAGID